jgi:hypothetical protein
MSLGPKGPKGLPIASFNEVPSDESSEAVMFPIAGYSYEFTSVYSLRGRSRI